MLILKSVADLTGYTLVIPSVSLGNVGQLAMDLMISTLNCEEIGHVWHPAILPVVGASPFIDIKKSMITGCQVYKDSAKKLVLIQFRAPILNREIKDLLEKLLVWIKSSKMAKVVILTGGSYTEGRDALIAGVKLRYYFTPDLQAENKSEIEKMFWTEAPFECGKLFMPASGFAKLFYAMIEEAGIRGAILVKYCSEGNNVPDAFELANYIDEWMNIVDNKGLWNQPPSWKHLFGKNPTNKRIF